MSGYDQWLAQQVEHYMTSGSYPDCDEDCFNCDCTRCAHAKEQWQEWQANNLCDSMREDFDDYPERQAEIDEALLWGI